MSQRAGPGFATGQTTSAWSLAQRKKDAGIESSTRGASSDRAARGFGADSPGMGPQGRISVPAESAGDLGGPTSRSDIFLDDVSVSRRHVELRWEKDDFHDHAAPFSGKWYHTESAINEPRYRDHIPVMLGGSDEKKTFRLAARNGDHLNLITPMSELRHKLDVLKQRCSEVGRDLSTLETSTLLTAVLDGPTVIRTRVRPSSTSTPRTFASTNGFRRATGDTVPITEPGSRAWNYVTLGLGHPGGATLWSDFANNLRAVGYDGTLNIEHEDALVNSVEGVSRAADLLKKVALVEPADWTPANV